jgi:hypothetical protein
MQFQKVNPERAYSRCFVALAPGQTLAVNTSGNDEDASAFFLRLSIHGKNPPVALPNGLKKSLGAYGAVIPSGVKPFLLGIGAPTYVDSLVMGSPTEFFQLRQDTLDYLAERKKKAVSENSRQEYAEFIDYVSRMQLYEVRPSHVHVRLVTELAPEHFPDLPEEELAKGSTSQASLF